MSAARTFAEAPLTPGSEGAIELRRSLGTAVTNYATAKGTLASLINEVERAARYCRRSARRTTLGDKKTRRCVEDLVRGGAPFMLEETGLPASFTTRSVRAATTLCTPELRRC